MAATTAKEEQEELLFSSSSSLDAHRALDPVGYLRSFTEANTRPSGRPLHTTRITTILPTILSRNTYGSSLVKIGNTQVLSGITLLVGHPGPLTPNHGDVDVSINVSPLCAAEYNVAGRLLPAVTDSEMHRQRTTAPRGFVDVHTLESFVQRTLRTSGYIDPKELSIQRGSSAWRVQITIMVLNHDGNLEDACLLGALSALADLKLPRVKVDRQGVVQIVPPLYEHDHHDDDNNNNNNNNEQQQQEMEQGMAKTTTKLTIQKGSIPIPLTMGLFRDKILVDMTREEEAVCEGVITVVVNTDGEIVSFQKNGGKSVTPEEMGACVHLALGRAKEVEGLILDER